MGGFFLLVRVVRGGERKKGKEKERTRRGDVQSHEREGEERLVDPADHGARRVAPVLGVAGVREGAGHVPGQERPGQGPEDGEADVQAQVEDGVEGAAAVEGYG